MEEQEAPNKPKYKRKRKKTFLMNARKYAKKGSFGRGYKVEEDVYQYFVRVLEASQKGFPSVEEQKIFSNNVFEQTVNNEVNYSMNQVGSRLIESLIPYASDETLKRYMDAFASDLRPLCNERFASHVLEALLTESAKRANENEECKQFWIKVSKFLLNNMEDYMWDTYGNYSMRRVFISILRLPADDTIKKYKCKIDDVYKEILEDYAERILSWPQFTELPLSEVSSGFLQVLLKSLKVIKSKLFSKYLDKLLMECFAPKSENPYDSNNWPPVFMSKPNLMVLETALTVCKSKHFIKIYESCFKGLILKLASTKSTTFCIQKLMNCIEEKCQFEEIFDELNDGYDKILNHGHPGVLHSIGQACKRFGTKQGVYIQNLMKAFNCFEPQERQDKIVLCLCKLVPFDDLPKENATLDTDKLNLQGALIVQLMLTFNKPIKIISSLLNLPKQELAALLSNTMGSHLTNSFVESEFVGEKSREKLIRSLQGFYQQLASTTYGSRSFDLLWEAASMKFKIIIMEELSYKDASWSNTHCGRIIASKVQLHIYKSNPEEWKNTIATKKEVKKNNLAEDILGSNPE